MSGHCEARQYSDQMICGKCSLQWDVNDIDPPQCSPVVIEKPARGKFQFYKLRNQLRNKNK